jgi:hypothetical protein
MYQQLWGYKVEERLYLGVREQKRFNTTALNCSNISAYPLLLLHETQSKLPTTAMLYGVHQITETGVVLQGHFCGIALRVHVILYACVSFSCGPDKLPVNDRTRFFIRPQQLACQLLVNRRHGTYPLQPA